MDPFERGEYILRIVALDAVQVEIGRIEFLKATRGSTPTASKRLDYVHAFFNINYRDAVAKRYAAAK